MINSKYRTIAFSLGILFSIACRRNNSAEDERYILPREFTGAVLIIFNQKDGEEKEYDGKTRIYRVPKSGVLKTQFQQGVGYRKVTYVSHDIELYYLKPNDGLTLSQGINDSLFVFSGRTAQDRHWFSVGRIKEMDSLAIIGLELVNKY